MDSTRAPDSTPLLRLASADDIEWPDGHGLGVDVRTTPPSDDRPVVPPTQQALAVDHEQGGSWKGGRAGMRYRDLIPGRHGGAYIASHIHVPDGGPVPDYVHFHDVVHQLIFCHRGWVRVVYEDQGEPFVLRPGDCVLQPPGIRHRVLEASDDLFVVEVGCPAVHRTSVDHDLELPNAEVRPGRRWNGQLFVRHVADEAPWRPTTEPGGRQQDLGLGAATDDLVSARRIHVDDDDTALDLDLSHDGDLRLVFVTDGSATLTPPDGVTTALPEGSSATIPAGDRFLLTLAPGAVLLDVTARDPHDA